MNFLEYIQGLRIRSEAERQKFALLAAAGVTVLLFIIWLVDIRMRFRATSENETLAKTESPLNIIKNDVMTIIDTVKTEFK